MAKKEITQEEEIRLSKRAYVQGFANTLRSDGKSDDEIIEMAKKAVAHRETLYSEDTQKVLQKRASDITDTVREIAGSKNS